MMEISKVYQPKEVEEHWMDFWEKERIFIADIDSIRPSFVIVIPPPNVTGSLHMGHMLVYTLHDIVVRWRRMQGYNTLWLPGTDHAGIATQNVVERQLEAEGKSRHDLGREAFEKRVWSWKEKSGNTILKQLRRLGGSCDWTRERFTLDEGLSRAVREVFVQLYEEGLIYRGKRLINWCVRCRTALSDLEVKPEPSQGKLYYICYPIKGDSTHVTVATTRPETMLGDTAVAVNPQDKRYLELVGKTLELPLGDRTIPVIADVFVDPKFGTGLVKVTPAHDPNDFEIGQRHNLEQISVMDEDGNMTDAAGPYKGLDRFTCRAQVVKQLEKQGLLQKIEDHYHSVGQCDRCKSIVEPLLSTQWFVKIKPLADPAIRAVEEGRIRFVPENWSKTYFEWMQNIKDWCISRQLWWGHRIPAWYCNNCGQVNVDRKEPTLCVNCSCSDLTPETDVLDTWFSSALWPFSTLGWPEPTRDLKKFYPTSLLITGFDIIFFWVARMIMMGLKFTDDVPFRTIYINSLVRDAEGKKMSKSKGNVIDPLDVMEQYGTDAVRFTLAIMATPGTDISLSHDKILSHRAFANKIWNSFRLVSMNLESIQAQLPHDFDLGSEMSRLEKRSKELSLVDRWILSRLKRVVGQVNGALETFRFHEASHWIYHFFWGELCDWYIEFLKPKIVAEEKQPSDQLSYQVLLTVFDWAFRLMHPFMPFITEDLWQRLPHRGHSLATQPFPDGQSEWLDPGAESQVEILQDVITKVRNLRSEMNLAPGLKIKVNLGSSDLKVRALLMETKPYIMSLARCDWVEIVKTVGREDHSVRSVASGIDIEIPIEGLIDFELEKRRIEKEITKLEKEMTPIQQRLRNAQFMANAPAKVTKLNKDRLANFEEKVIKLREYWKQL